MAYYLLFFLTFTVIISGSGMPGPSIHMLARYRIESNLPAVLYLTRSRWLPLVPVPDYIYHRLPSTFAGDAEAGFTSSQFDLSANIAESDSRAGLDNLAKRHIQKIMRRQRVDFDEARRLYMEQRFAKNNIDSDGRPTDPKFVSFS
ncbi:DUF2015 domain-containing protein [Aspergillus saccharolyticus JOP 1030-1]|uniref:Uncharacterized protein n=1 Tax=Aspergillus saccharolyticus JOP 1030-1 TaxID=1450539 RepID=A0A318ZLA6_9EURO|nr:hypothetical protein BP01DRAFT_181097 [Aspergillus saccharolyticus JOP 1030-1]PYH48296.1 hypothetical protein BP01DRAFT_181097 [Aspergillus saccharolyticus JOP 1030-1]